MDDAGALPQIGSYATPLIISVAGLICSTLAMVVYHFVSLRFCFRRQQTQDRTNRDAEVMTRGGRNGSGVDEEVLKKIPILPYSTHKGEIFRLDQSGCAICLGEVEDGEMVRLLPACRHAFHITCIDGWFLAHSNCPVCRSPITSQPELPVASENDGQERVSHVHPLLQSDHQLAGDLSASNPRLQPSIGLRRHSASMASHREKKPQPLVMGLKRSLSMDESSYIAIKIQREQEKASTSKGVESAGISKARSLKQHDHVSSMLMRSFSQFRKSRSERSCAILPT